MTWTQAEARFATTLPGYESRTAQRQLAETIEKALANIQILLAQAGTGTGKSLANMVPAIEHAIATGTAVVISTATKALQSQYALKDVPFLLEHLGIDFRAAVLKGRSNYACAQKISELKPGELEGQDDLIVELQDIEHDGDVDNLITSIDMRHRMKITSTSDECPGKNDCPFGAVCFAEKAKAVANRAQIVIVNHSMLITDLQLRARTGRGILPEFEAVVIDEAHEFEEYATNSLGKEFTERGMQNIAGEAANFMGPAFGKNEVAKLNGAAAQLFKTMTKALGNSSTLALTTGAVVQHQDVLINALEAARELALTVYATDTTGDDQMTQRRKRLARKIDTMAGRFEEILTAESEDLVRWIERDEKRGVLLKFAPLHVGPFLASNLWTHLVDRPSTGEKIRVKRAGVLLSATLAYGSDFSYIAGRLGVSQYQAFDAGTPFNYPRQSALFVPTDCDPVADKGAWKMQVQMSMVEMVRAAGGRTLALFTSTTAMKEAYAAVAPYLENDGIQVLMQGEMPNRQLAEIFKSDETSVLFALKSFMTGFDVQGDALRLVIIDKLPFAVPTDVIWKARCDAVDAAINPRDKWTKGAFPTMVVPSMALILEQAFGRLIRTMTDEGLVAIMDSRLRTKRAYGPKMLNSLPPARRVGTLTDAVEYLEELTARRP